MVHPTQYIRRLGQLMPLRNRETSSMVGLAWFGPAVLTIVFIAVLGMLLWFMQYRADTEARRNLSRDAGSARTTIQTRLESTQDFLMLLTDEQVRGTLDAATFQERVSQYVIDHPELINVTWADAEFIIRWTAPYEPNKQIIGLALTLPEPKRASHLARDTARPAYTRPFVVIQGTPAVEVYVPVFRDGQFPYAPNNVANCPDRGLIQKGVVSPGKPQ